MKITLIHGKYYNSWEALGLGYIGAYLKAHAPGIEIDFYQGCFDDDDTIIEACSSSDIVAFSCTTPTFPHAAELVRKITRVNPHAHMVVGGYHASASPGTCLADGFDQVVIGEGEAAMLAVVKGNRERILQGRPMLFSELPWPDRALIKNERNIDIAYADNQMRITSFQSHRGCPFRCKYCLDGFNKVLYGSANEVPKRYRSISDLLDEIEAITQSYRLDMVKFSDPTWNTDIDWVKEFCRQKIARGITVPFYPNIHAGRCTHEMLELMAEAGCFKIAVGIESGSPKILKQIGKGTTITSIEQCISGARRAGVPVRGYFILGMPDEADEDVRMTEALAERLELDEYGFSLLCPYPGTQMFDSESYYSIDWEKADEYSNDFWRTKHLSNEELKEWQHRLTDKFKRNLTWHNKIIEQEVSVK